MISPKAASPIGPANELSQSGTTLGIDCPCASRSSLVKGLIARGISSELNGGDVFRVQSFISLLDCKLNALPIR